MTTSTDAHRDEVDHIVDAWSRERPDLDVGPLEVLSRITRLARRLDRVRRAAIAEHGLDAWEFDVLVALRRAGAPYELSPGALIDQTMVTSGTMTNRVDRLVKRGLVERHPSPHDRRGVIVRLTEAGRTLVDDTFASLLDKEHALLAGIPNADRRTVSEQLRQLLTALETDHTP